MVCVIHDVRNALVLRIQCAIAACLIAAYITNTNRRVYATLGITGMRPIKCVSHASHYASIAFKATIRAVIYALMIPI